MNRRPSI